MFPKHLGTLYYLNTLSMNAPGFPFCITHNASAHWYWQDYLPNEKNAYILQPSINMALCCTPSQDACSSKYLLRHQAWSFAVSTKEPIQMTYFLSLVTKSWWTSPETHLDGFKIGACDSL